MDNTVTKDNISLWKSFARIWPFLRDYKVRIFGALLLVVLQVLSNVLEPFIFGLIITEITANVFEIVQGVPGAG